MKIKTLLIQSRRCKTSEDADNLLEKLQDAFCSSGQPLSHLGTANKVAYMEDKNLPFVQFELNHEISKYYITMIRPEISDGKFVVLVATNHMLDGLGMSSKNWEIAKNMKEEVIEADSEQTINSVAKQAKEIAITNHRLIIERAGVPSKVAKIAAQKNW